MNTQNCRVKGGGGATTEYNAPTGGCNTFSLAVLFWLFWAGSIANAAVPVAPILRVPGGEVADMTPTYVWTVATGATTYQLWVADSTGLRISKKYQKAKNCNTARGLCSANPAIALAPGKVVWRVRAGNTDGWGPWSKSRQITVSPVVDSVQNVLEAGDRYDYFAEATVGELLFTDMWRVLNVNNAPCWISEFNTLTQYQFYKDPSFLPGPLYRFSGIDVSVGRLTVYNIGWYFLAGQTTPLRAAYVNAGIGDFFLVIADKNTFAEAFWHNGNYLVITHYHIGNQCL